MEHKAFLIVTKAVLADKRISATAKLLLAVLRDHENKKTGQCNPRRATLAGNLDVCTKTVTRSLAQLCEAGYLTVKKGQRGNTYVPCTSNPAGTNSPGRENPAGTKSPGARSQNVPAEPPASLYEPDLLNKKREEHAHSDTVEPNCSALAVGGRGALFPLFFQCFVNAGVALNAKDERDARRVFERYDVAEQERIGKWVIEQLQTVWRSPQYTPTPLNALRSHGWDRQAAPRIVPKPPTREQELLRLLEARRTRSQG